jgi:hypothetical protein
MRLKIAHYYLELTPDHLAIYREMVDTLQEALLHNQEILLHHPNDHATRFALGNVLRMQGQIRQARQEYTHVAQSDSPWAQSAAQMLAELEGMVDLPRPIDRTRHSIWSMRLWSATLLWSRWSSLMRGWLNRTSFTPEADNLSRAIIWVLQQEGRELRYNELFRRLQQLTKGTTIVWSQIQMNQALYSLWRERVISSPGTRWLPKRPETIDGLFDNPAWHTMQISLHTYPGQGTIKTRDGQ